MFIKRCPHCNGEAWLRSNYSYKVRGYFVFVQCTACSAQGKVVIDRNDPAENDWNDPSCDAAVSAWNLRYKEGAE